MAEFWNLTGHQRGGGRGRRPAGPAGPRGGVGGPAGHAARLRPVLVHGDIHEDQLLVNGGRLTGVIDWETARFDHPYWDFDLGEWGTGLWRRRRRGFSALRARGWRGVRGAPWARPRLPPGGDRLPPPAGAQPARRSPRPRPRRHLEEHLAPLAR